MTLRGFFLAAVTTGALAQSVTVPIIQTIAGTNPAATDQNGAIATGVSIIDPQGAVLGPDGNFYFGEFFSGRVRRLILGTPEYLGSERIDTVAGPGYLAFSTLLGFTGDGAPAILATVSQPQRFAFDSKGNLYFTDVANHRVAMVTTDGVISTVAGTGVPGFSGDGGPATKAQLNIPRGIAIDATDNIYIGDGANSRIRRVANGAITTFAGTGTPGFSGDGGPASQAQLGQFLRDLLFGPDGTLYISGDSLNNGRIRAISPNGVIRTFAGGGSTLTDGGLATQAQLQARCLAFDRAGNLYVCDNRAGRVAIRRIAPSGTITTVAGGGTSPPPGAATSVQLQQADGVAIDSQGKIYITDASLGEILLVDTDGNASVIAGGAPPLGDGAPARQARLDSVNSLAVDGTGRILIGDGFQNRVRAIGSNGVITTIAGGGTGTADNVPAVSDVLTEAGITVDSSGVVYVADAASGCVRKIDAGGQISRFGCPMAAGFSNFAAGNLAVDAAGNVYAQTGSQVVKITPASKITLFAGNGQSGLGADGGPAASAQLLGPLGVAVSPDGSVYIADQTVVHKVTPDGTIHIVAGTGTAGYAGDGGPATQAKLSIAESIAVNSKGNLYIADVGNNNVRIVLTDGTIRTFAGNGQIGFSGDGLAASMVPFDQVSAVAIDASDNVYIADQSTVRKVAPGPLPSR